MVSYLSSHWGSSCHYSGTPEPTHHLNLRKSKFITVEPMAYFGVPLTIPILAAFYLLVVYVLLMVVQRSQT